MSFIQGKLIMLVKNILSGEGCLGRAQVSCRVMAQRLTILFSVEQVLLSWGVVIIPSRNHIYKALKYSNHELSRAAKEQRYGRYGT